MEDGEDTGEAVAAAADTDGQWLAQIRKVTASLPIAEHRQGLLDAVRTNRYAAGAPRQMHTPAHTRAQHPPPPLQMHSCHR